MNRTRYLVAVCLLAFSVQAKADGWLDDDINDILAKVRTMFTTITGDVKDTAQDLNRQLTSLTQKGATVKEHVEDALDLAAHRRTPFLDFVNGPNGRCGEGSTCLDFRLDLENFVLDMADLRSRFPHIQKHGFGDGTIVAEVVDHLPPLVLFGLYEILNKVPDWQDTPQHLADFYDEIGDPDVFSEQPLGANLAIATNVTSITVKGGGRGPGQANFGPPSTKLDLFCSKGKQLRNDPVRLNRVRMAWTWVSNMLDGGAELVPDGITVVAVGEGGKYPLGLKGFLKLTGKVIESIFASVDAHRANIGLCKQIEADVAQRTPLVTYRTAAGNKNAYWVVKAAVQTTVGFSPNVEATLDQAGILHQNGLYQQAYSKICDAYAAIGGS